jgi:acetyl-CoA acyltransferase
VLCAIDSLQAGCHVVLATGVEVQTTVSAREGADFLARAAHYDTEREIDDFTFPCLFARRGKAYKEAFGATSEDFDHITVKAYNNGNKNPKAHMKNVTMSLEKAAPSERNGFFLANETYREHLKISDCSQVSDGASALVLATEEGLRRLGISKEACVEILSYGHATGPLGQVDDLSELGTSRRAAEIMYRDSGLTPQDVQVAEVHDCFSLTEVMMYEALGFASPGEGAVLARSGETGLEGRLLVN